MKKLSIFVLLLAFVAIANAQGSYIPRSWSYDSSTGVYSQPDGLKLKKHTMSSDHFDVYYGEGYGSTTPEKLASTNALYVNVKDLLEKAEWFFQLYIDELKFADLTKTSNLNKYKMIICILHDTGWTATGSGYDDKIGALWITPSTCHPVGQTIAHEIGHAFQYQTHCDLGGYCGFRESVGNGSAFWEQTAQWQSVYAYPNLMMSQSIDAWKKSHNYAFTHEWHRYQSYWLHFYWADKHGIDAIGRVWRGGTVSGEDPCQVYMRVFKVSVNDFYKEIFDYACKMATYDMDAIREYGKSYIGQYTYNCVDTLGKIQVAYSSCPQSTGFNIIPLEIPAAGTKIQTVFTAINTGSKLVSTDPAMYLDGDHKMVASGRKNYNSFSNSTRRGFRHGYVALLNDGTRIYQSVDTVYAKSIGVKRDTTSFVVPRNCKQLYFVVSPAPSAYFKHLWDENIANDDMWPYQLEFENTDVIGHIPSVDLSDDTILPSDTIIHINVEFNPSSSSYDGTVYKLKASEIKAICEHLRVQPTQIASMLRPYETAQPINSVFLLPFSPTSSTYALTNKGYSTNSTGHWFTSTGAWCYFGSTAYIFSDFDAQTMSFTIGQNPGKCLKKEYQIGQCLRVRNANGKYGRVRLLFHVYVGGMPKQYAAEDVNHDDNIDSQDVLKVYDYMQNSSTAPTSTTLEDVNKDGTVDSQDVLKVYDAMMNS